MMRVAALPETWRGATRYASALRWLATTLWQVFRWRLVATIAAAQVGVLVVGAGLSLSLAYLQSLERDEMLRIVGLVRPARDETTLTIVVVVVLVVLLTGAGIVYLAQRSIVRMAVALNHHVRMDIALAYGGELSSRDDWRNERTVRRALWQLQTRDARRTAIVARGLLRNTVNLGIAVVGIVALFYLEVGMTLLFLTVMAAALISYYRANVASARATRRYEAVAPSTRQGLHRMLTDLETSSQPAPSKGQLEAALDNDALAEEADAFRGRFGAHIHAEFLGLAIMGVALAGLTAFMGRDALAGTLPWTRLVAYLLVLRFTLNGIRSVMSTFAFFSRFYPSIDRLNRFFAASNGTPSEERLDRLPLRRHAGLDAESEEATRPVERGEVVEVILPVPLSRYSLGLLAPAFAGHDRARQRRLLGQMAMAASLSPPPAPASMSSLLMLDGSWDEEQLRTHLGDQASAVEETVGLDPCAVVSVEAWTALPEHARGRLVLVAAAASDRPVLALDRRLTTTEELARLRASRDDRIIVVCSCGAPEELDPVGVDRQLVVSADGEVLAVGPPGWIAERWDTIGAGVARVAVGGAAADEDLDDDE